MRAGRRCVSVRVRVRVRANEHFFVIARALGDVMACWISQEAGG